MTPILSEPRFYVYILLRPDATVFYVGKGQRRRTRDHENEARRGHRCHKCNTIRHIWAAGGQIEKQIIFRTDVESEALAYEQAIIAQYGRDALCNQTDGGEGTVGHTFSTEHRAKIGAKSKGRAHTDAAKEKMRAAKIGKPLSPASIANLAIGRKNKLSAEHAAKLMEGRLNTPITDAQRRAIAESNRRRAKNKRGAQ